MRFISLGFGKVKPVQCYVSLLIWLIFVSIGLYWFLNRSGTGLSTLTQTGFGYHDGLYQESSESDGLESLRKNQISKSTQYDSNSQSTVALKPPHSFETNHGKTAINPELNSQEENEYNAKLYVSQTSDNAASSVVNRLCNPVETIKAGDENVNVPDFKLEAIIILFRHGDRGPLTHIGHRNVSHINCEARMPEFEELTKFATDSLMKLPGYSQFIGPFHSFPKVPSSPFCSLGQLSQLGSAQLLTLGKMIRSTYKSTLVNLTTAAGVLNAQPHPLKVIAYSTRYRRTFQSLFAFLYGLLGPKQLIQSTTIHESQSIAFCFKHCSCKAADRLKKAANKKFQPSQEAKETMTKLVTQINSVLGTEKSKKTGNSLLDSLLVYPCHKFELPCHQENQKDKGVQLFFKTIKNLSLYNYHTFTPDSSCVTLDNLKNLIKLINQENLRLKVVPENRNFQLLSSYGILKEIVNLSLKMTSSASAEARQQQTPPVSSLTSFTNANTRNYFSGASNPSKNAKIVVFSGHDTTLQSISAALGIFDHPDVHLPPFSSRLLFEFYRRTNVPPNSPRKHYFRVIYNGIAVTHLVTFCTGSYSTSNSDTFKTAKESNRKSRKNKYYNRTLFCPIENLVRFLHDHYFDSFGNATNFKDACKL